MIITSAPLTILSWIITNTLCRKLKLQRPNFKGDIIPVGIGFMLIPAAMPIYIWMLFDNKAAFAKIIVFMITLLGFSVIGLLDDIYGTREVGGFRGHLGLLKKGRISTGLIKMVGGGLLGLTIGIYISQANLISGIINEILIALSANTLNLLDLRPGRAVSCLWVGILALVIANRGHLSIWPELIPVLIPAVFLTVLDRSAKVMLGDAGSNALGAVLGISLAYEAGLPAKVGVLLFMAVIHIYSEKRSISELIESNGILRRVDRLLGER